MKHDLRQIAASLAGVFLSFAGAIPVERLVANHIDVFEKMRSAGLTWEQISRLLAGVGVVRGDGSAFSPSHLRGVFGRQRKRSQERCMAKPSRHLPTSLSADALSPPPDRRAKGGSAHETIQVAALTAKTAAPTALDSSDDGIPHGRRVASVNAVVTAAAHESPPPGHDRSKVLALMRQATLARRAT